MDFFIWERSGEKEFAWLEFDPPQELYDITWRFSKGKPITNYPTEEVIWRLDKKKGNKVGSFIPNNSGLKVVNSSFKQAIEKESKATVEFFPIRLRDTNGNIVEEQYWIVNLLDSISCMISSRSVFVMDPMQNNQVDYFSRLVIDNDVIPAEAKLFRLAEKTDDWLISKELALIFRDQYSLDGTRYIHLKNYGANFRNPYSYKPDPELGY